MYAHEKEKLYNSDRFMEILREGGSPERIRTYVCMYYGDSVYIDRLLLENDGDYTIYMHTKLYIEFVCT